MRLPGLLAGGVVVVFWISMNTLLVLREVQHQGLGHYRRGVADFLGERVRRERWMGIYRKGQRIGQTGFAIERRLGEEEAGFRIEFSTRVDVDLLGQGSELALRGSASLDPEMVPQLIQAEIGVGAARLDLSGRRESGRLLLVISERGRKLYELRLPLRELQLGDGLAPVPPVAGLEVGDSFEVPVFDPIFRESTEAQVRVTGSQSREVDGIPVDCLELETRFRGMRFRSFVTRDGEVLRQELPPPLDLVLVREPPPPVRITAQPERKSP